MSAMRPPHKPIPEMDAEDVSRFWAKVIPQKDDGCWLWSGAPGAGGYGHFKAKGVTVAAHRVAYALATDTDPGEFVICHHCDVRLCVKPYHLFRGTPADNIADMMRKGRHRVSEKPNIVAGEAHPGARLTAEKVREIRASREPHKHIARRMGVSTSAIFAIRRGRKWRHISD